MDAEDCHPISIYLYISNYLIEHVYRVSSEPTVLAISNIWINGTKSGEPYQVGLLLVFAVSTKTYEFNADAYHEEYAHTY